MGRPPCCKRISGQPVSVLFQPAEVSGADRGELVLELDEFEALRLAHVEGLYQEEAARQMGVSRATFGRILEHGQCTVARAIVQGKSLRIQGQAVPCVARDAVRCEKCQHQWHASEDSEVPPICPQCRHEAPRDTGFAGSQTYLCPKPNTKHCHHVHKTGCCPTETTR